MAYGTNMTAGSLILLQGMGLRELEMAMSWEDKMMTHSLWGLCLASAIYKVKRNNIYKSLLLNEDKEN